MARNINSLLSKKGWTGKEVGKALILSLVNDILHQREPDYKPLFSPSDFERMESSIDTERDYLHYSIYRDIYSGLLEAHNHRQGLYQQFHNGCNRYVIYLKDALIADKTLKGAENIPYVMTEEQYNSLKERAETRLKGYKESFCSLFFTMLSEIMESPEDAPEAIRDAIEATKQEAVTNEYIFSNYNEAYGLGYYQLADGTRSDQTTSEEWKERLKAEYLKTLSSDIASEPISIEDVAAYNGAEKIKKANMFFFMGIDTVKALFKENKGVELPQEVAEGLINYLEGWVEYSRPNRITEVANRTVPHPLNRDIRFEELIEGELESVAEWHYYTEAPTDLTKYDIVSRSLCFYNGEETEDGEPHLTEFKADYPTLYKALESYIKELIPQTKSLKPSQYSKDFISWGELAELGIQKYIKLTTVNYIEIIEQMAQEDEDTTENRLKRSRILFNGINIAKEPNPHRLNERGEYIDNALTALTLVTNFSIDNIGEYGKKDIVALQENLIKPSLRYIYSFNVLVKIIGAVYGIEEMGEIELETTQFEERIDAFNDMLYMFYADVYGTIEEKKRKRELIKEIFSPIDYEELKPTPEAIDAVTAEIEKLGFTQKAINRLKDFDTFIEKLSERGL